MGKIEDKFQTLLNRLKEHRGNIVYDCETSGLRWQRNYICGHVLTLGPRPQDSVYIPVRHAGGGNLGSVVGPADPEGWDGKLVKGEKELLDLVFRQGRKVIGHNIGGFDLKFLFRLIGTQAFEPQFEDTQINEPLVNEFSGKFSLEACCLRRGVQPKLAAPMYAYLREKFPEIKSDRDSMGWFYKLAGNDKMAVDYAEGDGTSTWQLRDSQMVDIWDPHEYRRVNGEPQYTDLTRVHNIESRLIRILARMTCRGIKVDEEYFEQLRDKLNGQISRLIEEGFAGHPNIDDVSFQAGSDVKWYMEKHGVTNWPMTPKTKKPSFPESWLKLSEPGRKIIAGRQVVHMRNSFITPLLDEHIWKGRVHANFNQLRGDDYGTIIGRLSADSPNLQQAHKRDPVRGRMLRGGFVPDDGMVFAEADYRQCEPVLLAYYSRCKVLLDGFRAVPPIDAHAAVTRAMFLSKGYDSWDAKQKKEAREAGKRINQTLITGGGKGVIVEKYGVDPTEVDEQYRAYFKAMPEIKTTQNNMLSTFRRRGYMVTLLGRRLHLPNGRQDLAYVALNRILSGGNSDVLKSKIVEIDDYLESEGRPPVDVLLNIHDSLDFQFDPAYRPVYNECLSIMTRFGPNDLITLDVPLGIDVGEGKTWSEATFGLE